MRIVPTLLFLLFAVTIASASVFAQGETTEERPGGDETQAGDDATEGDSAAAAEVGAAEIAQLIEQLGDERYAVREYAQTRLMEIGAASFEALSDALEHDDLEVANRARYLLGTIEFNWTSDEDPKEIRQMLENFADTGEAQRLQIVDDGLAGQGRDAELRALCRIVRYDRSSRVSKRAALALILQLYPSETIARQRRDFVLKQLGPTRRNAAQWCRAFFASEATKERMASSLQALAQAEQDLLSGDPEQTSAEIVARLCYVVADQLARWEETEAAEALAQRAFDLELTGFEIDRLSFLASLQERGRFEWAEREFRRLATQRTGSEMVDLRALELLANMLHDQRRLDEAVETVRLLIERIRKQGSGPQERALELLRRRMSGQLHYFMALQAAQAGDVEKEADELRIAGRAAGRMTGNPDILIAQYRLPERIATQKRQVENQVRNRIVLYRNQIGQAEENTRIAAFACNQFAWLVGNTLGEVDVQLADEAIEASLKSLEYSPYSYAYTDTLARCYYARGDLENAIKFQHQALALNPYSGLLQDQLKFFESKLAERQSGDE
ncbi:MAG: hypothetical protein DWQ42_05555 [Planctomycetota bacterium]|nr:MAG: hypothetical protein DWQ42_05555 [Planctomycetota bacterium]REK42442.1 MAG: hypothetical protein DWQ46_13195 [Planctomycetota bacterium]